MAAGETKRQVGTVFHSKKVDRAYDKHLKEIARPPTKLLGSAQTPTFEELLNRGFVNGMEKREEENRKVREKLNTILTAKREREGCWTGSMLQGPRL
ncbi:MAG: hypothetical protein KGH61_00075 [Candidatus Micrarchaeota archaeon]|nr:hypothetical protein [Candidatus Micrarchaeota archaeon]MDE1847333.1 hypothetical protein [Candidatus Micrarchaeota archaeon]MDE1863948.1 hypothetical protein [Candidatus Micrarchaeota archaeon]